MDINGDQKKRRNWIDVSQIVGNKFHIEIDPRDLQKALGNESCFVAIDLS